MLLSEILRSSDDRANTVWQLLSKGEQVSEEIIFQLLEQKINSPEVRHHGKYNILTLFIIGLPSTNVFLLV